MFYGIFRLAAFLLLGTTTTHSLNLFASVPVKNAINDNSPQTNGYANNQPMVGKTAIILNTNARSVSPKLGPIAQSIYGESDVFLTTNAEEALEAAQAIASAEVPYSLVIPVGGDGTLTTVINDLVEALMMGKDPEKEGQEQRTVSEAIRDLPLIGYIPLGTGNGLGSSIGCTIKGSFPLWFGAESRRLKNIRDVMEALKLVGNRLKERKDEDRFNVVELPMIEVCKHPKDADVANVKEPQSKGDLCFFAGVGFDSLMLDDFKVIKAWSKRTGFFPKALGSVLGYSVALVTRTLPKALSRGEHKIHVKVSTKDKDTLWVDHRRGDFVQPIAQNILKMTNRRDDDSDVDNRPSVQIFSGTTGICCAGTSPFYGGGLRLFPFARLTLDQMHVRLGRINPLVGFVNIPSIFAGSYRDKSKRFGVIDFLGRDFEIEVESKEDRKRRFSKKETAVTDEDKEESNIKGYPFQHSGESMGHLERFRLRVTDEKIRFVNFMERRCVSCDD